MKAWTPKGPKASERCRFCGSPKSCKLVNGKMNMVDGRVLDTVSRMCAVCTTAAKAGKAMVET